MKAVAVFPAKREVRLIDHPAPRLERPTQARVRILDVGVCGTDKEICRFEYGTPPPGSDYLVLGHESFGEVVEAGPEAGDLKTGDSVVLMVRRPCGRPECAPCAAGVQDFCETGAFVERGIDGAHGFMTEEVVDEARYCHRVPPNLRDLGVLVEPLTIAEKSLLQVDRIQRRVPGWETTEGRRAVVLGAGPVGLLGAMALRARGFAVWVYSRSRAPNPKAALAESFGCRYVSTEETPPEALAEEVGKIDLVYEGVGVAKVAFEVAHILGKNGIFVLTGIPPVEGAVEFEVGLFMRNVVLKNQVILGTVNAPAEAFRAAIRDLGVFAERWPAAVRGLVTARVPPEGFLDAVMGRAGGIKNVVSFA